MSVPWFDLLSRVRCHCALCWGRLVEAQFVGRSRDLCPCRKSAGNLEESATFEPRRANRLAKCQPTGTRQSREHHTENFLFRLQHTKQRHAYPDVFLHRSVRKHPTRTDVSRQCHSSPWRDVTTLRRSTSEKCIAILTVIVGGW